MHFVYPSRPNIPILRGLSLTVEPGTVTALVGPSGCGKSSLIGLLQRFYDVTAGSILLDGVDIRRLPVAWLRAQMALVQQVRTRDTRRAAGGSGGVLAGRPLRAYARYVVPPAAAAACSQVARC